MTIGGRLASLACVVFVAACGGGGGPAASTSGSEQAAPAPTPSPSPAPPPAPSPAPPPPSPPPPSPPPAGPKTFVDVTAASGIAYEIGYRSYLPLDVEAPVVELIATGGAAAGDYDSDGDVDLFITRGDIGPNLLYRNNGAGVFDEVAAAAGLAYTAAGNENYRLSGPTFADMDGDGDLDLFIGGLFGDPSFVYANNGDGTFSDVTAGSGIDTLAAEYNISAAFGDYDLDGDLDLFVAHWGVERGPFELDPGDTEHLWRNDSSDGAIVFTSVSQLAGIAPSILTLPDPGGSRSLTSGGFDFDEWTDLTFAPTFARIDEDLYPDILSVADVNTTQFFSNNGDGTFANATDVGVLTDRAGMGSAVGDYDNDGDLDWFVSAIAEPDVLDTGNRLYENDHGVFVDRTGALNLRDGGWGWAACFMDFENDGDLDLYHTNGWAWHDDYAFDTSRAFVGSGGGPFVENAPALGLDDTEEGRGVVCADFDNDGDVDIFQLHRGSPVSATLWRNDSSGNNYLKVDLDGLPPNTEAAGGRIYVTVGAVTQMREIMIGSNFVSQNPTIQVFGLGNAASADEVRVEWPDGLETTATAVAAGQTVTFRHPSL